VNLPEYSIIDLGKDLRPVAVNDNGTVLLYRSDNHLIRWQWGRQDILLDRFISTSRAFLNETGTVVAHGPTESLVPEIRSWQAGDNGSTLLQWDNNLIAEPYYAELYALNDRDDLILRAEASDNPIGLPPEILHIETNLVPLEGGDWTELSQYEYYLRTDLTLIQGGRIHEIASLNNYGDTVGLVYEDQATSSAFAPDPVYTHQEQFFTLNGNEQLDFEPLCINDAATILGRTLGPVHGMTIRDRFGQRQLGPEINDDGAQRIRMSNPQDGLEEIILGQHYWKRMNERDLDGNPTDAPAPDFWKGALGDIIRDAGSWTNIEATCISSNGRIAGTGHIYNGATASFEQHAFLLQGPVLIPDWDRNGIIDTRDQHFCRHSKPLRFWINDDDDEGPLSRSSADDRPESPTPDWASPGIDGLRDVVDFFAVQIDLQGILRTIWNQGHTEVLLKQADEAVNFVYTNLHPRNAGDIHSKPLDTGFGSSFAEPLDEASTQPVTTNGVTLSHTFLDSIRSANQGLLLFEATSATTEPLVLELHHEGNLVLTSRLPLSISPVEDMFRIINLRNADPKFSDVDPGPWGTRTGEPSNLPDTSLEELTAPLRTLVHVHGYNWTGHEAPAGHSELFKRFYQSGSNARFIGISWYGDQGTLELTGGSWEYNENVINAFITAKYMADALQPFSGPEMFIFAHSLGNMVASSAILDHGLEAGRFFMTNAAVPEEAYLGQTNSRRLMVHPDWKDELEAGVDYAEHLLSPNWHWLFPSTDNRFFLKWKNRFSGIGNLVSCINYYSSGEEVLRSGNGDIPTLFGDAINQELVWVFNEMIKGTQTIASNLSTDIHGGWGFNRHYMDWVDPGGAAHPPPGEWVPMSTQEAGLIALDSLTHEPFFHRFSSGDSDFPTWGDGSWLYGDAATANAHLPRVPFANASMDKIKNHAKVIAEAIPAHSAPAGSNPLPVFPLLQNVDLDREVRDPSHWPQRDDPAKRDRWLHSDYMKPALSHVSKFYKHLVNRIILLP
jgi:hypothetical protein